MPVVKWSIGFRHRPDQHESSSANGLRGAGFHLTVRITNWIILMTPKCSEGVLRWSLHVEIQASFFSPFVLGTFMLETDLCMC